MKNGGKQKGKRSYGYGKEVCPRENGVRNQRNHGKNYGFRNTVTQTFFVMNKNRYKRNYRRGAYPGEGREGKIHGEFRSDETGDINVTFFPAIDESKDQSVCKTGQTERLFGEGEQGENGEIN